MHAFWTNHSQSKEDRDKFRVDYAHLFKIKRSVLELVKDINNKDVVVDKSQRKVYFVNGHHLKLIAHVSDRSTIHWEGDVQDLVRRRAVELVSQV